MALSKEEKKRRYCPGCRNDIYNHPSDNPGGVSECFHLKDARIVWLKEVHINDVPPWNHKAKRLPHCYQRPKFVYVGPNQKY